MFLTDDQVAGLFERALTFAETKGFKVEHDGLLAALKAAGASVDDGTQIAKFGRSLVQDALKTAPKAFTLAALDGKNDLQFPHPQGAFHTRTNTGATRWLVPGATETRPVQLADVNTWATVARNLENIGFVAFPSVDDVPQQYADVAATRHLLGSLGKHAWVQPYSETSLRSMVDMALIAGGGEDAFRERPIMSIIGCSLSPFTFKPMDCEVFMAATKVGMPIHACSLPGAGGTSPVTPIGTAFTAAVEIMGMVVIANLLAPGHPVIGTPLIFTMDMRNGRVNHSTPEALRGASMAIQLVKQMVGVPAHTYGAGSDSPIWDRQASVEAAIQSTVIAYSGAEVLGAAGQFETATCISPLQLILDNEVFGLLKTLVIPKPIDDAVLGWDTLMAIEHGGTFLTEDHTYDYCRDVWGTKLLTRVAPDVFVTKNVGDLDSRLMARYEEIIAAPQEPVLSDDVAAALNAVVDHAKATLG